MRTGHEKNGSDAKCFHTEDTVTNVTHGLVCFEPKCLSWVRCHVATVTLFCKCKSVNRDRIFDSVSFTLEDKCSYL
jgi:hypothetical protein